VPFIMAGPELLEECRRIGGCPAGEARITQVYRLPCALDHPYRWSVRKGGGRGEARLLASCYESSLKLAAEHNLASDWEVISSA
jgi:O-acetyl-ADP-ribose deacetylase